MEKETIRSIDIAEKLILESGVEKSPLAKMVIDPKGRDLITALTDQCFRTKRAARAIDQLTYLIHKHGIPQFFDETKRIQFLLFQFLGPLFPRFFYKAIRKQIRREMGSVLFPEDPRALFERCKKENLQLNLNHLGEAILGEGEAKRRLELYLETIRSPHIDYLSVKITTLFSQIHPIGWDTTLERLAEPLRLLYRAAGKKFINLDMEEYKDLELTVALFKKVLSEPEFLHCYAGIALQSYLPDSFAFQKELTDWARKRGGAPIRIRLVKGANLAAERVESSIRGWTLPTFESKVESDANFKRMLEFGTRPENAQIAHIGVASHNLFDIAYALTLRQERGVEAAVFFEMLSGMAEPMRRVVARRASGVTLYCPEASERDFHHAVAYLLRRIDENCSQENFLPHYFDIKPNNAAWKQEKQRFLNAFELQATLSDQRKRTPERPPLSWQTPFKNEPDTDFSLPESRNWALELLSSKIEHFAIEESEANGYDPSFPEKTLYTYALDDQKTMMEKVEKARADPSKWERRPFSEKVEIFRNVAALFRERRQLLIQAMVADAGKAILEADPEVSEAIDFIEYYLRNWSTLVHCSEVKWRAKGAALIAPPWNFPCAIPTSGIVSSLIVGNRVLFKPAPEAVWIGYEIARCFWEGGVPKEALQFLNVDEKTVGNALVAAVDLVLLTGATETAYHFMKQHVGLDLHAETGGKNALILTSMCDRDLAIRDLVHSAFSHSGQKCSACSLAVIEAELYDDPTFQRQLKEAAKSLVVDSAWNPNARVTPLIRPPNGPLKRALKELEPGESWLLEPKNLRGNPHLWSPGIKWGVREGSFTHQTELFGPLLGVMRADSLPHAIELVNATPYGLTSGIHTLDEREQQLWKEQIEAGNLYINRTITGAVVRRQPFGGCKASGFGPGAKVGGPNYLLHLAHALPGDQPDEETPLPSELVALISSLHLYGLTPEERECWRRSAASYAIWVKRFTTPSLSCELVGQTNLFYHVPRKQVLIRCDEPGLALLQALAACLICKTPLTLSSHCPLPFEGTHVEGESEFLKRLEGFKSARLLSPPSEALLQRAAELGVTLEHDPVHAWGRLEPLHYLREVALSHDFHRYGYLPPIPQFPPLCYDVSHAFI